MENARLEGTTRGLPGAIPAATPFAAAPGDLTSLDLLLIITRRKKLVALITALCLGIALVLAFTLPPQYTSTVTILPPQGNSLVSLMLANQIAETSGAVSWKASNLPGIKSMNDMYVSLMKSQPVEDAVIQRYGLQSEYRKSNLEDTRKTLESHTTIDGATKDGLIRLTFTDRDPNRSAEIANGYVEQFKSRTQHLNITEASQWRVVFENRLQKARADLENADQALKPFKASSGSSEQDSQARAKIGAEARMRAQIVAKEVQIEAMRSYPGDAYPALIQAQADLVILRTQFDALNTAKSLSRLPSPSSVVPQAGADYLRRMRDMKYAEATVAALEEQLELARMDEAREDAFLQVVAPASVPERASFPKRGLFADAGLLVGFTLGIMLAFLQGGLVRMQQNPASNEKLGLLKMSLWGNTNGASAAEINVKESSGKEKEEGALRHVHREATGSGF